MKRIAVLLAAAGIASTASAQGHEMASSCSPIEVTAPGLRKQPKELRFSTREILDLDFETRLERKVQDGDHVLHFKVFTPSGFLYQDLATPFGWGRRGHRGPERQSLRARLPVTGTSITMSTLYGRWTVQAFLDDQTRACSPPRVFTIESR